MLITTKTNLLKGPIVMDILTHSIRYLPHELNTRYHAVKLYRSGQSVAFVCRKYHISKSSLMRWNKRFDGTKESLADHSHKPKTEHPNAHTEEEIKWIKDIHRRNPNASVCEIYGKLRTNKGYSRHPGSLYRVYARLGFTKKEITPTNKYKPQKYNTPTEIGVKWQMDVKYVPAACYTGSMPDKFYQYTIIDEASRERFIYPYREQSSYSTIDFINRAIHYFGYIPKIIQTDNGQEFTYNREYKKIHPMDKLCDSLGIKHKLIRPRTPRHNGKVERSHRLDQERFYNHIHFYSYDDLKVQMKRYLNRYNNTPKPVLKWKTPLEKRAELEPISNDTIWI